MLHAVLVTNYREDTQNMLRGGGGDQNEMLLLENK